MYPRCVFITAIVDAVWSASELVYVCLSWVPIDINPVGEIRNTLHEKLHIHFTSVIVRFKRFVFFVFFFFCLLKCVILLFPLLRYTDCQGKKKIAE